MKKIITGLILLTIFASCGNNKKVQNDDSTVIIPTDTLVISAEPVPDNIEEQLPEEEPEVIVGESFDDFIYNFTTDKEFQHRRIIFPLPVYDQDVPLKIEKEEWTDDNSFAELNYYTLIFDREEDMELAVDTSLTSIRVEWIYMVEEKIKKYYFERIQGKWMLEAINQRMLEKEDNKEFIEFLYHFANDSIFQREHICEPLLFVTTDPDDDFAILESTLEVDQWFAFKPTLPDTKLSNINYGQINRDNSSIKILELKGIGYGFSNILHFKKKNEEWKLYKYEDTSN